MKAILSGGKHSGKDFEIKDAFAAIWVSTATLNFFNESAEVEYEPYILTSVCNGMAFYNSEENK